MELHHYKPRVTFAASMPRLQKGPKTVLALFVAAMAFLMVCAVCVLFWVQASQRAAGMPSPATVTIQAGGVSPLAIHIQPGQSVMWINKDTAEHQVAAADQGLPDLHSDVALRTGEAYSYPFEQKGIYHYFDPLNPEVYQGTVIVE
jgi:plastocyanin